MGQFSWLDCKTQEQVIDNAICDVYALIPKEFGGGHIKETCYDGYGHFGGYDIYDLVAEWNRSFIFTVLNELRPYWQCDISERDEQDLLAFAKGENTTCEKRYIGIILACYDEDNMRLKFPIKITHDPNAVYEKCMPSKSDPNQGWPEEDDDDEWY